MQLYFNSTVFKKSKIQVMNEAKMELYSWKPEHPADRQNSLCGASLSWTNCLIDSPC